jgi:hypothetical protein
MALPSPRPLLGTALAALTGATAGWWWQNRAGEIDLEERTRIRLRAWDKR